MWIKLLRPVDVFGLGELPAGQVESVGGPKGKRLVAEGAAVEVDEPIRRDPENSAPAIVQRPVKRDRSAAVAAL